MGNKKVDPNVKDIYYAMLGIYSYPKNSRHSIEKFAKRILDIIIQKRKGNKSNI